MLLRGLHPPMLQIWVDRDDDGFLVPLTDVIDKITERDAEKITDVQPDKRPVVPRDEVVERLRAIGERRFRDAAADELAPHQTSGAKKLYSLFVAVRDLLPRN